MTTTNDTRKRFMALPDSDPIKPMYGIYRLFKKAWKRSHVGKDVTEALLTKIVPRKDIQITEALCLGLGTMSDLHCQPGDREISLAQLAIFACWIGSLRTRFQISKIYLQDPVFTKNDVRFLRMLGFTVIFDNSAAFYITEGTFLFAPFCPYLYLYPLFAHVQPALFISNDRHNYCCQGCVKRMEWQIPILYRPSVRSFFESRASSRIPLDNRTGGWANYIYDMKIYWKASEQESIDEWVEKFYNKIEPMSEDDIYTSDDEKPRERPVCSYPRQLLPPEEMGRDPMEDPKILERLIPLRQAFVAALKAGATEKPAPASRPKSPAKSKPAITKPRPRWRV